MNDVLEISYTGDLLAHRRCPRAWSYEKYAQFQPHERAQAMEGRLIHHAMEWMTIRFREDGQHPTVASLKQQLDRHYRVLWARGIKTAFQTKDATIDRISENLFPGGTMHETVRAAIEGAVHTEYELRTVRKIIPTSFAGKSRLMLTGILDLVVQQTDGWTYERAWTWGDRDVLGGEVRDRPLSATAGDVEIWDYKGTIASTPYTRDYVLQLLTYARLYGERSGSPPARCVLFFVNEPDRQRQLVAIEIDPDILDRAERWTLQEASKLRTTMLTFERNSSAVEGGDLDKRRLPVGQRVDEELKKQCTACSFRFDCREYRAHLGRANHPDVDALNVRKT